MNPCEICKKPAKQKITNHNYCDNCFCKLIEKRVRKELRTKEQITHNDKILVLDDASLQAKLNIYLLKKIITDPTIRFETKKTKKFDITTDKINKKTVLPWCLEDKTEYFLKQMTSEKRLVFEKNMITPLETITMTELVSFAKIKKINTPKKENKVSDIAQFIANIDKKYVGTKQALIKSVNKLYELK